MAQNIYFDINTFFGMNTEQEVVVDEMAIINTYLNLILIPPRSRKFRPTYSAYLHYYLGEPVTPGTAAKMKATLLNNLSEWQPYGKIDPVKTQVVPMPNGAGYFLDIVYKSLLTGIPGRVTLQLYANQSSNVASVVNFNQ